MYTLNDIEAGGSQQNGFSIDNPVSALPSFEPQQTLGGIRTSSFADTRADLTRAQWADFQTRYLPVQNELLALANNDTLLTEQLDRNKQGVDSSFSLAEQGEAIRMGRYGLTPENSQQSKNNSNLLKNLTKASVSNETRSAVDDLQNKIITGQGGAPSTLADIGG